MKVGDLVRYKEWRRVGDPNLHTGPGIITHVQRKSGQEELQPENYIYSIQWGEGMPRCHRRRWLEVISESR